jgi:phosphatidylglycerol:prolipoprotein diacylglycerol transferase
MHRYLLIIGNFRVPAYGVMAVIGYLVGMYFINKEAIRNDIKPLLIQSLSMWVIVGMLIGARIWYVWENWTQFAPAPLAIFKLWEGGMVFYGGFIGGFAGGVLFMRIAKLPLAKVMDIMAPGIAIAVGIGRIGCFLNGCCYGRVTESWIGVSFPARWTSPVYWDHLHRGLIPQGASHSLPVIPTQLISALNLLIIFGILWKIRKKTFFNGFLFALFTGLYGLHRFTVDFFRYYSGNALILKYLTLSQVLSIFMMITSVFVIMLGYGKQKKNKLKKAEIKDK